MTLNPPPLSREWFKKEREELDVLRLKIEDDYYEARRCIYELGPEENPEDDPNGSTQKYC